ncbi:MAG: hypothetical protein WED07_05660 [Candidatus Freyarchaeum deiterrae]
MFFIGQESLIKNLVNEIRNELRVLGSITARGLALFAIDGRLLYLDMTEDIRARLNVFIPSFPVLTVGSNITVNIGDKALLIMRVSERMVLAIFSDQRVGVVLTMMSSLTKKYDEKFDKAVEASEENKPT